MNLKTKVLGKKAFLLSPEKISLALHESLFGFALLEGFLRHEAAVVPGVGHVVLAGPHDGVVGQDGGVELVLEVAPLLAVGALDP